MRTIFSRGAAILGVVLGAAGASQASPVYEGFDYTAGSTLVGHPPPPNDCNCYNRAINNSR